MISNVTESGSRKEERPVVHFNSLYCIIFIPTKNKVTAKANIIFNNKFNNTQMTITNYK